MEAAQGKAAKSRERSLMCNPRLNGTMDGAIGNCDCSSER